MYSSVLLYTGCHVIITTGIESAFNNLHNPITCPSSKLLLFLPAERKSKCVTKLSNLPSLAHVEHLMCVCFLFVVI